MTIKTRPITKEYEAGWERTYSKKKKKLSNGIPKLSKLTKRIYDRWTEALRKTVN